MEVYCLEDNRRFPCDADYFRRQGFFVNEREYGTRIYKEMFTLLDTDNRPFIEIRRSPFSTTEQNHGFFDATSCHIRFVNRYCYHDHAIDLLRQFILTHNYTLVKISRIDICLDFERFDRGDDPAKFLLRYMRGKYSKINQANINAHGKDQWDGRQWNSLSWGRPKSMISTKFYNKTMELAQVHDKPYIRQAWFLAGLVDDPVNLTKKAADGSIYKPDIWRVEFSIKASAKKWYVIENHNQRKTKLQPMPHTLDMYDTRERQYHVFASLAQHYFHFKKYQEGQRKDRCEDKILFDFSGLDTFYKVESSSTPTLSTDTPKANDIERLLDKLRLYRMNHADEAIRTACDVLIKDINQQRLRNQLVDPWNRIELQALQMAIAARINYHSEEDFAVLLQRLRNLIAANPDLI